MNTKRLSQIVVTVGSIAAGLLFAGRLAAGELEPPGPPAPTMKSLDEIPGSWSRVLSATDGGPDGCDSSRFRCVLGGGAVLDLETGLVWERSPSTALETWPLAALHCSGLAVGPRRGWRLPRADELQTLADPAQTNPALPPGHPFQNIQGAPTSFFYWTATTDAGDTTLAEVYHFGTGLPDRWEKSGTNHRWCLRGGGAVSFTSQPNL